MHLSSYDKPNILKRFPSIELSYEKLVYKKVHNATMYMATLNEPKCFAWFTYYKNYDVCLIVKMNNNRICDVNCMPCCFDRSLSYGTLLYGSVVKQKGVSYFYPEDILQFKGR